MRKRQPVLKQEKTLNPELKTWLYASGSLTQQLTELGGEVQRKAFQRTFPAFNFCRQSMDEHASYPHFLGKETYLYGSDVEPWVKAKVFFPFKVYKKPVYFSILVLSR